jgi:hypothetical protein
MMFMGQCVGGMMQGDDDWDDELLLLPGVRPKKSVGMLSSRMNCPTWGDLTTLEMGNK